MPRPSNQLMQPHEIFIAHSRAARNISRLRDTVLRSYELTSAEWLILGYLRSTAKGKARVGDVALALDVQSTYITGRLRTLTAKGLVTTEVGVDDRRVRWITTSKRGDALMNAINSEMSNHIANILTPASMASVRAYQEVLKLWANTPAAY